MKTSKLYNDNGLQNENYTNVNRTTDWDIDYSVGDHFLRLENAISTLRERKRKRLEYLKKRQELEAQGKLPVSIQEIRRAKENEQAEILDDSRVKTNQKKPLATSEEAMLLGKRTRAEMHLSAFWKTCSAENNSGSDDDAGCKGQSCHLNVPVYPSCPVVALADTTSDQVIHDFDAESTCMIPVDIILCSTWMEVIPECIIQVSDTSKSRRDGHSPKRKRGYFWCGTTRRSVKDLQPNARVKVPMSIAVVEPGTFILQNIEVLVKVEGGVSKCEKVETTVQMEHRKMITVLHESGAYSELSSERGITDNSLKGIVKEGIQFQSEESSPHNMAIEMKKVPDAFIGNHGVRNVGKDDSPEYVNKRPLNEPLMDQVKQKSYERCEKEITQNESDDDDDLLLSDSEENDAAESDDVDENYLLELEKELS
eukprot:CAMPEP_0204829776 /NCGR_PEP_ID=MMETSP1346-20131115/8127_1 /ASSEMBLY_ACC=CAM_ASM_000771 /TAXON_ID=215587 /ORGANISM="Aplanochytrium stocchinoi, Strain GSBS06" /LENGTH=424 /DNA_ID=CAMNT_0051959849 /DNA_START=252 /DNA_END=1526 /DNA_ORIENTATION=-